MTALTTLNGWSVLDDNDPAGAGGNAIQDNFVLLAGFINGTTGVWTGAVITHEKGGLEADVSAYNGLLKISGGNASEVADSSADWNTAHGWGDHSGLYDDVGLAAAALVSANAYTDVHEADTTAIHGIADTSALAIAGGAFHDGFSDFSAYEHGAWKDGGGETARFETLGEGAFGWTALAAYKLFVYRVVTDTNGRHGVHVSHEHHSTQDVTASARALSFAVSPHVDATFTNAGGIAAVRGEALTTDDHDGTLAALYGFGAIWGCNTGGTGTVTDVFGFFSQPYRRGCAITNSYHFYAAAPVVTAGTVTNEWVIYSLDDAPSMLKGDVQLTADNKKFMVGGVNDASFYYDGTNVVINPKEVGDGQLSLLGAIGLLERSTDPAEPAEGYCVVWMSDGTGKGDDGDVMIASKAGGTTNYGTLFDHSGGAAW